MENTYRHHEMSKYEMLFNVPNRHSNVTCVSLGKPPICNLVILGHNRAVFSIIWSPKSRQWFTEIARSFGQ